MIRIDDEYVLNANESCYTLETITKIQDVDSKNYGKSVKNIEGYYTTVEDALKGYLKCKTRKYIAQEEIKSIFELIQYIKELEKLIKNKFDNVKKGD